MPSIIIDLFSGKGTQPVSVPVNVYNMTEAASRLGNFAKIFQNKKSCKKDKSLLPGKHIPVCREILQHRRSELLFFPFDYIHSANLTNCFNGRFYFVEGSAKWSLVIAFESSKGSRDVLLPSNPYPTDPSVFVQEDGYPLEVINSIFYSFSANCISFLVSQHGLIMTNSDGQRCLKGISVSLLQTPFKHKKSVFLQRQNIAVSPIAPLREEGLGSKSVKINCFCKQRGFVYSICFAFLTSLRLEAELKEYNASVLSKYGNQSSRNSLSCQEKLLPTLKDASSSLLICFPIGMNIDVPFGTTTSGSMFFSGSEDLKGPLKLVVLPPLLDQEKNSLRRTWVYAKNWHIENEDPDILICSSVRPNIFLLPNVSLVQCSPSEYRLTGMNIEIVSTPRGCIWGIFCSTERETSSSSSKCITSTSKCITSTGSFVPERQSQQRHQGGGKSPVPGPSGVRYHPCPSRGMRPQASSSVSVPPERQSQQREQESPLTGPSAFRYGPAPFSVGPYPYGHPFPIYPYGHHLPPYPYGSRGLTVRQLTLPSQASSSVSVPPERQSQQRHQESPVPGPSGVGGYGPAPFSGGRPYPSGSLFQYLPLSSVIRQSVLDIEPLSDNVPVQRGAEDTPRGSVIFSVGNVSQTPLWKPDEGNFDEESDSDIDVVN